jgi:hypothetical protein
VLAAHEALVRRAERDPAFAQRLHAAALRSIAARAGVDRATADPSNIERRLRELDPEAIERRIAAVA